MSLTSFQTYTTQLGFKDPSIAAQFEQISPALRAVILELSRFCDREKLPPPILTSLIRTPGSIGVSNSKHFTGEAADIRLVTPETGAAYWTAEQEARVSRFLIGIWGPRRKIDTIKEGGIPKPGLPTTAPHIHIEVD